MTQEMDHWYRALLERDARFDGRFFIGVKTTGIYCRPVCPAPKPKRQNCLYMPSASAAEAAGFRACRRCRPETAPGSAAWRGVETTIARALKLIEDGALDGGPVEDLAARLGIGERYLRRLFTQHLGASPVSVAQTHRLHTAKRLIETTDLPMTDVAGAAGFQSLRRFNDAFAKAFDCAPSTLRKGAGEGPSPAAGGISLSLRLPYRAPLDWDHMTRFLAARAVDGAEYAEAGLYARTFVTPQGPGTVRLTRAKTGNTLIADLTLPNLIPLRAVIARLRGAFDLDTNAEAVDGVLGADPLFAAQVKARPGIRMPCAWDLFEYAVRAIVGQQISVKGARTILSRITERLGTPVTSGQEGLTHLFPAPEDIAKGDLTGLGLTTKRAQTLQNFAARFAEGDLDDLDILTPEDAMARLTDLPGIGPWTAQMIAMKALGYKDAFPATDLGVLKALGLDLTAKGREALAARAQDWAPWRGYAAMRLWTLLEEH